MTTIANDPAASLIDPPKTAAAAVNRVLEHVGRADLS